MTVTGGVSLLILFLEILVSVSFTGIRTVSITSPRSFAGFCLYAVIPVIFYFTGIGLFLLRPWARKMTLTGIPVAAFFFFLNLGCHVAKSRLHRSLELATLLQIYPEIFTQFFVLYVVLTALLVSYFRNPSTHIYFQISKD